MQCENCDSFNVVEDAADTEFFQNDEGDYYYLDTFVYTCQDCGYSWEEIVENR